MVRNTASNTDTPTEDAAENAATPVNETKELEALAKDYAENRVKKPGYGYRFVTRGGTTNVVVTKIAQA